MSGAELTAAVERVALLDREFGNWIRNVRVEMEARGVPVSALTEADVYSCYYGECYDSVTMVDVLEVRA